MSLPATGTRLVTSLGIGLALAGLAAIVAPRYLESSTLTTLVTVVAAVVGFVVPYLALRPGSAPSETRTRT